MAPSLGSQFKMTLSKPIAGYQFYQVCRQLSMILISIILVKMGLGQESIGRYESLLFLGNTLSLLWLNGLINSFMAAPPQHEPKASNVWAVHFYWAILGFTLISAALGLIFEGPIQHIFLKESNIEGYRPFLLYFLLSTPVWVFPQQLLIKEKGRYLWILSLLQLLLPAGLIVFHLSMDRSITTVIWSLVMAFGFFHLLLLIQLGRGIFSALDMKWFKAVLKKAMPLFVYAFFGSLAIWFDNWLVQRAYPDEQSFALFRYGAREFPIALVMATALSTALIPAVAGNLKAGMAQIRKSTGQYFHFIMPMVLLLFFASPYLFEKVYNVDFRASALIFNAYLLITASRLILPQTVLLGLGANRYLLRASIYECLVNVLATLALLPAFGLEGIAIGTAIAFTFEKLYYMTVLYRNFDIYPSSYIPMNTLMIYSTFLLLAFSLSRYLLF